MATNRIANWAVNRRRYEFDRAVLTGSLAHVHDLEARSTACHQRHIFLADAAARSDFSGRIGPYRGRDVAPIHWAHRDRRRQRAPIGRRGLEPS